MSGGYFDHKQYYIEDIADEIERAINTTNTTNTTNTIEISKETRKEFRKCVKILKKASIYVHRIDYFLEGDDNEDAFHRRLKEDLQTFKDQNNQTKKPKKLPKCQRKQ